MPKTVDDLYNKAAGDIEVIVVLEGYWPTVLPRERPTLKYLHRGTPMGLRHAFNSGAQIATGKYLMKVDAHCMFGEGWDEILQNDCDDNWVVIPSRYSLDAENWAILNTGKARVDYHFLCYPFTDEPGLHGVQWDQRRRARSGNPEYDIDEEMSFQGSCAFMTREHFFKRVEMMDTDPRHYGTFIEEPQEIGLKTQLRGGKVMVNKKTWYAHLHKGKQYGRGYSMSKRELIDGAIWSVDFWTNNRLPDRVHDFEWLIDHFWEQSGPIPTWPENWHDTFDAARKEFHTRHFG